MIVIGTQEEVADIKNQCDGRCAHGEWCVFGFQKDVCPIDGDGCYSFIEEKNKSGSYYSALYEGV